MPFKEPELVVKKGSISEIPIAIQTKPVTQKTVKDKRQIQDTIKFNVHMKTQELDIKVDTAQMLNR